MSQDSNEKPATLLWYGVVAAVVSITVFVDNRVDEPAAEDAE